MAKRKIAKKAKRPSYKALYEQKLKEVRSLSITTEDLQIDLNKKETYLWQAQSGAVDVKRMKEDHLRNAVAFVTRRMIADLEKTVYMETMLPRAEGLFQLLKECKRRGLKI